MLLRIVRSEDLHMRYSLHFFKSIYRKLLFYALNSLEAKALHEADALRHADGSSCIDGTGLKLVRHLSIGGATAGNIFYHLSPV